MLVLMGVTATARVVMVVFVLMVMAASALVVVVFVLVVVTATAFVVVMMLVVMIVTASTRVVVVMLVVVIVTATARVVMMIVLMVMTATTLVVVMMLVFVMAIFFLIERKRGITVADGDVRLVGAGDLFNGFAQTGVVGCADTQLFGWKNQNGFFYDIKCVYIALNFCAAVCTAKLLKNINLFHGCHLLIGSHVNT